MNTSRERSTVADVSETDFSSGVRYARPAYAVTLNSGRITKVTMTATWANYTAVSIQGQVQLDGTNWSDISGARITVSGDIISFELPPCQQYGILVTATLSGSTDTLTLTVVEDHD